jgi:hypothetical protein
MKELPMNRNGGDKETKWEGDFIGNTFHVGGFPFGGPQAQ